MNPKRRLVEVNVAFLSLVPVGANNLQAIYKEDTGAFEVMALAKLGENGELLAVVYAPEFRDSQGDIASADVCKQMAYSFAKNGAQIDVRHDGKPVGRERAFVAENFIVQKGDPRFAGMKDRKGTPVDPTGGWAVLLKLEDPELRKPYSAKEWGGVSLGGTARVVLTEKEEWDMDAKELLEILKVNNEAIIKALKPEPPAADDDALFKGDPTNIEDVKKHAVALRKIALLKNTDWTDPESVAKLQVDLEKAAPPEAAAPPKSQREIDLEKELADLRKEAGASNRPAGADGTKTASRVQELMANGLSKEDAQNWVNGESWASEIAKEYAA